MKTLIAAFFLMPMPAAAVPGVGITLVDEGEPQAVIVTARRPHERS